MNARISIYCEVTIIFNCGCSEIQRCHIFIGLYGERYGGCLRKKATLQMSPRDELIKRSIEVFFFFCFFVFCNLSIILDCVSRVPMGESIQRQERHRNRNENDPQQTVLG
jgi:hypothetical protein